MSPKPLAIFSYYGVPTFDHEFFRSRKLWGPEPYKKVQFEKFLIEPVSTGSTPSEDAFSLECLSADGSRNPDYLQPKAAEMSSELQRAYLYDWLVQENQYPDLVREVDKGPSDPSWSNYPPTIMIHGDVDEDVPMELSQMMIGTIGPTPAKLYIASGQPHNFDEGLFLGDPALSIVEDAWKALDAIINTSDAEAQ